MDLMYGPDDPKHIHLLCYQPHLIGLLHDEEDKTREPLTDSHLNKFGSLSQVFILVYAIPLTRSSGKLFLLQK